MSHNVHILPVAYEPRGNVTGKQYFTNISTKNSSLTLSDRRTQAHKYTLSTYIRVLTSATSFLCCCDSTQQQFAKTSKTDKNNGFGMNFKKKLARNVTVHI